ncbi:MAG: hypothetical protein LUI87_05030 [Lachnospiraceae bacterium]|nr:hypothetical protein [Lachnospiraceae bacterium]
MIEKPDSKTEYTELPEGTVLSEDVSKNSSDVVNMTEDAVMKVMMEFFSEEMLPVFGITKKATTFVSTEETRIELKKSYQDFNFLMEDDSIAHFEFQTTNEGIIGLRRFRAYEANLSYIHKRSVITYVLFSGNIKVPMTELTNGVSTFKVIPIIMSQYNADIILAVLREKINNGEPLTREDLVVLPLLPTFSGESTQVERIKAAFEITTKADQVPRPDIEKIEAAIYAMATKFLSNDELSHIKGVIKMTYLGQLLVEDGRKEGLKEGLEKGREEERKNTERERKNAERERSRADKAEADLLELKKRYGLA